MNAWCLPRTARIGGEEYGINADFRDVLDILRYLADESRPLFLRWMIAVGLFYDGKIPEEHQEEAAKYLAEFIDYDIPQGKPSPKLIDWEQDAQMIIADVNKVAGKEVRAAPFIHWWTFLSYFYGIGEGQLSTVVSIRAKKKKGKKLEKWEQEFYRENREKVDFRTPETAEVAEEKANLEKWL